MLKIHVLEPRYKEANIRRSDFHPGRKDILWISYKGYKSTFLSWFFSRTATQLNENEISYQLGEVCRRACLLAS